MRLGYCPGGQRRAVEVVAACVAAERAGFDEIWLTEDYFQRGVFTLAAAVAVATTRIRIGLGVVNTWTRHPALIAMEFGALDELSAGRAVLGLGTSNPTWMRDQLGLPFRRPLAQLAAATTIIRRLLAGERVRHRDEFFHVDAQLECGSGPAEIIYGVKGAAALGLAAHHAAGVLLPVCSSPAYIRWVAELVGGLPLAALVVFGVDGDSGAARERTRPVVARYLGLHGDHPVTATAGLESSLAERFRGAWQAGEDVSALVSDDLLDTFAVVGDRAHCAAGLDALAAAGLSCAVIDDDGLDDPTERLHLIRGLIPRRDQRTDEG